MKPAHFLGVLALLSATPVSHAEGWALAAGANLQYDWYRPRPDVYPYVDADDFRRARVSAVAKYDDRWEFKAEYDLEPGLWTDSYVKLNLGGGHSLRAGQFKQPMYLDELTSDKYTPFMEQGLPTVFALFRRLGVEYAYVAPDWTVTTTAFGKNSNTNLDTQGAAARATWIPWRGEGALIHLGLAGSLEQPDNERARFSVRPESAMRQPGLVDTGRLDQVDTIWRLGLEGAWQAGPWSLQGEYTRAQVDRDGVEDFAGDAWYVLASWFPTGESRGYRNGVFDAPVFGATGRNAWELALRLSQVDLDDGAIEGGEQTNWTLGVNWYPNKNLRFSSNYIVVDSDRRGISDDPNILQFRAMLAF